MRETLMPFIVIVIFGVINPLLAAGATIGLVIVAVFLPEVIFGKGELTKTKRKIDRYELKKLKELDRYE
jgi:hypothetical protein